MTITNKVTLKSLNAGLTPATDVPDAPTIGTATAGVLSASVAFTAAATGGTPTSYTATSSPGGFTGTGSSPITVSGLSAGTSYTFTVTATNASGTSPASSASNSVTPASPLGYESISTVTVGSGGSSSISFTSIPSTYTHLQIRCFAQSNRATYGTDAMIMQFNSDTGSNYASHWLGGNGSSTSASADSSATYITMKENIGTQNGTATFGATIIDILDYANTSKYKTARMLSGTDVNGTVATYGGWATLGSGLWQNTNAITSIVLKSYTSSNFVQYSSFALYGVK